MTFRTLMCTINTEASFVLSQLVVLSVYSDTAVKQLSVVPLCVCACKSMRVLYAAAFKGIRYHDSNHIFSKHLWTRPSKLSPSVIYKSILDMIPGLNSKTCFIPAQLVFCTSALVVALCFCNNFTSWLFFQCCNTVVS